jgi:ABC-type multidrug transport system ATPase subunit
MNETTPKIQLDADLEIGYGSTLAKVGTSIRLNSGTHFLVARNGRGKTTLLRTLAGSIKPVSGHFEMQGFVQYLAENIRFDQELPTRKIFSALLKKDGLEAAFELADRTELDVGKPYGKLSTGNKRKANLIVAECSTHPDGNILLLDEPLSGLDVFVRQTFEELWHNSNNGILRLVSCHPDYDSMDMPSSLLIEDGKIRHLNACGQKWSNLKVMI